MTTRAELEIIGIFNRDISQILSISQISRLLNKAYPHVNSCVNGLLREHILNKIDAGHSYLCSINLSSDKAVAMLSLDEAKKKEDLNALSEEIKPLCREFKIYTILYSGKKLYFIIDHAFDRYAIQQKSKDIKKPKIFLTRQEFQQMLKRRELLSDRIILYSPEKYFELADEVKPAILSGRLAG